MNCYKVTVETTDALDTTTKTTEDKYIKCKEHILFFVTDNPAKIYDFLGSRVEKIEKIGVGYTL